MFTILTGLYLIMHGRCLRAVGGGGEKGWLLVDFAWLECIAEGSQRL